VAARASAKPTKKTGVAIDQVGWDRIRPAAVILVSGPEQFLADRAVRQLRDQLTAEDPSLEVNDLQADHYQPGELITLASPSLFAEPRLIRVSNVEKCTDAFLTETLRYLESPADDTYLVLRHGGGVRGKKLLDTIRAGTGQGLEVVCAELKKDTEKLDFAAAEFAAERRRVTSGALRALVTAFSDDLAELASACQQLISDAADEITEATVEKYYEGRVETNAFKVADAAVAGRQGAGVGRRPRAGRRGLRDEDPGHGQGARRLRAVGPARVATRHGALAGRPRAAGGPRLERGRTGAVHRGRRRDRRGRQGRRARRGLRARTHGHHDLDAGRPTPLTVTADSHR
jgi:hypothetical protein